MLEAIQGDIFGENPPGDTNDPPSFMAHREDSPTGIAPPRVSAATWIQNPRPPFWESIEVQFPMSSAMVAPAGVFPSRNCRRMLEAPCVIGPPWPTQTISASPASANLPTDLRF